ncbi:MAG: ribonuclease P protein component [Bacteroidales bacterium]|nr:ribonuclease P protein component [Bacteroidales bacterium]
MPGTALSFSKSERLCHQRCIEDLFANGRSQMVYPFSIRYLLSARSSAVDYPAQILIAVPKRRLHHAVDRNRVKRLTRECYRLRKARLYEQLEHEGLSLSFALRYVANDIMDYATLGRKMDKVINALSAIIEKHASSNLDTSSQTTT